MNRPSNLPVPIGQPSSAKAESAARESVGGSTGPAPAGKAGAFDAQVLGQDGQKRGLKGGAPVLDAARSAYLGTEYSGEADRRPAAGIIMRSKI